MPQLVIYSIRECQCSAYIDVFRRSKDEITWIGNYNSLRLAKEKINSDFHYNFTKDDIRRIYCKCYYRLSYILKDISEGELCERIKTKENIGK